MESRGYISTWFNRTSHPPGPHPAWGAQIRTPEPNSKAIFQQQALPTPPDLAVHFGERARARKRAVNFFLRVIEKAYWLLVRQKRFAAWAVLPVEVEKGPGPALEKGSQNGRRLSVLRVGKEGRSLDPPKRKDRNPGRSALYSCTVDMLLAESRNDRE
jgi:hypothetical protein